MPCSFTVAAAVDSTYQFITSVDCSISSNHLSTYSSSFSSSFPIDQTKHFIIECLSAQRLFSPWHSSPRRAFHARHQTFVIYRFDVRHLHRQHFFYNLSTLHFNPITFFCFAFVDNWISIHCFWWTWLIQNFNDYTKIEWRVVWP